MHYSVFTLSLYGGFDSDVFSHHTQIRFHFNLFQRPKITKIPMITMKRT